MSKLQRFAQKHWLHAIQVVAWIALSYCWYGQLMASGWIPARLVDFGWWYVKGTLVCLIAALVVYGTTEMARTVVEAWRRA